MSVPDRYLDISQIDETAVFLGFKTITIPLHRILMELGRAEAELDAAGICMDCRDCYRHSVSDATTPGFFFDKCEKHRCPSK